MITYFLRRLAGGVTTCTGFAGTLLFVSMAVPYLQRKNPPGYVKAQMATK
jgi:hypothetical protein